MEPRKTSFIPKKMYVDPVTSVRRRTTVSIFSLVAIVLFLVSLSMTAGVFFYHKVLVQRLEGLNNQLIKEKSAFEPQTIEEVITMSQRIESVKSILGKHVAVHPIFELLSAKTYKNVQFTDFGYKLEEGDGGGVSITMKGIARGFEAVALQSDLFGDEKNLKNPVFDQLKLDKNGNVTFVFSAVVPLDFVSYAEKKPEEPVSIITE